MVKKIKIAAQRSSWPYMRMGGCNRDGVCNRWWKGWREAPCWFLVQVTEWQVELCVFECNKTRAGRALGTRRGGLLPVLLVSWQVRSPFCQRPHPQLNYCQTPWFLLFLLRVQFGQQSPPLCSGSWADVLKHVDGSLRIPICCPWRCARGAGNGCLCCRRYRELFSYTGSARISGH